jgi:hypothetical protein
MASDPVVEYWAELMSRTPFTPDVMAQWKRVMDHGLEAWSRALSEVMATEDFAQLLGTSIEQWIATQASITGNRAQPTGLAAQPTALGAQLTALAAQVTALAAQLSRLDERMRRMEGRVDGSAESTGGAASARTPRRGRRRPAA